MNVRANIYCARDGESDWEKRSVGKVTITYIDGVKSVSVTPNSYNNASLESDYNKNLKIMKIYFFIESMEITKL